MCNGFEHTSFVQYKRMRVAFHYGEKCVLRKLIFDWTEIIDFLLESIEEAILMLPQVDFFWIEPNILPD